MITIPYYFTQEYIASKRGIYSFIYASSKMVMDARNNTFMGQEATAGYFNHCYPVPTKWKNCKSDNAAFVYDLQFDQYKFELDFWIKLVPSNLPIILFPKIGLGCAELDRRGPKCYEYLVSQLNLIKAEYEIKY